MMIQRRLPEITEEMIHEQITHARQTSAAKIADQAPASGRPSSSSYTPRIEVVSGL